MALNIIGVNMKILDTIQEQMKESMKGRNQKRLDCLRMLKSAIMNEKIEKIRELTEEEEIQVLRREQKKRLDSIEQFNKGNRPDLAQKEEEEIKIIDTFLPKLMAEEDLLSIIKNITANLNEIDRKNFGIVMKNVMVQVKGKADGKMVNELVKKCIE